MIALCFTTGAPLFIGLGLGFAALHELGHLAALALCGSRPSRLVLTAAGVRMERPPGLALSFGQERLIALAGPAASLLLAGIFAVLAFGFPPMGLAARLLLSHCCYLNLGFGLFNLLPVRQLDGGRALYYILCPRVQESTARGLVRGSSFACLFLAAFTATLITLRQKFSLSLFLVIFYLALSA